MSEIYIPYPTLSPRMNKSTAPLRVTPGTFYELSGVDGRFNGCLRKFYGMKGLVDLSGVSEMEDIDTHSGPSFFKAVTFQKKDSSTVYRGFVIRWDSIGSLTNQQVDLIYTDDNGSTWAVQAIWATGNGITSSLEMDCAVEGWFLYVAVDTKAAKVIYWNGAALTTIAAGPGVFSAELGAMTLSSSSVDTDYQLRGNGVYQVAYRFYDSTRGIYSALSAPLTIHLDHYKGTYATGGIYFADVLTDTETITIDGRVYEADDDSSITGDVAIPITGLTTVAEHVAALVSAINGDSSAVVTAVAGTNAVTITAKTRGSGGNAYTLAEAGADITVSGGTLTGGGAATTEPEEQCKAVIDFPANDAVLATYDYDDFDALFDTVDVFRTIDLGNASTDGAIFYLEQSIAETGNWESSGTWDSLQVTIGTVVDTALPFCTMYDPEKDIVVAPPASGAIGRYQDLTFMTEATSVRGGYDILHSSVEMESPEYFTTYNRRKGSPTEGRPQRYLLAADSMFALCPNAVLHAYKSARDRPLQITVLHLGRGLGGKEAAHTAGNGVFMIGPAGLMLLNGSDGSMGQISAADGVVIDDWKADLSTIKSAYDSRLNASLFLDPTRSEVLIVWHALQTVTMLEGMNFVGLSDTPDITDGLKQRAYFITATGLIVSADVAKTGSGTAWDLSSTYTLNGTATSSGATLVDSDATFHADMVGALLYMVSGNNAGAAREIATVNTGTKTITFTSAFDYEIAVGDTYSVSPIPFKVRLWPLQAQNLSRFVRWTVNSMTIKAAAISGFTGNPCCNWRIGTYRNGGTSLETGTKTTDTVAVSANPADSCGALQIDGVDIEPYIEQISAGVGFEMVEAEVGGSVTLAREVS